MTRNINFELQLVFCGLLAGSALLHNHVVRGLLIIVLLTIPTVHSIKFFLVTVILPLLFHSDTQLNSPLFIIQI